MRSITLILSCVCSVVWFGCGEDSTQPAHVATFTEIYDAFFPIETKGQCNFCHGLPPNDKSNGLLSFGADKSTAYEALVGKTSASSVCNGKPLVVAGDPEQSLLLQKLSSAPPCGGQMPLGGSPLTDDQQAMVRSWIAAGAKND